MRPSTTARATVVTIGVGALLGVCLTACGGGSPLSGRGAGAEGAADSAYGSPVVAGRIEAKDVRESSGLTASECQDVLWTHNDSGNDALIYGMDTRGGHLGTWRVGDTRNVDWESISSSRDPAGGCSLIIGDIGNNAGDRDQLTVFRIPEPAVSAATASSDGVAPLPSGPVQTMTFRYPDGNHNAETILAHPRTGDIYVVTKHESGPAGVYRMRPAFDTGAPVTAQKVADVSMPSDPEGRLTGGSMSPDGTRVMLCDLLGGYELALPAGVTDPDAIWRQPPVPVDLGDRKQGEGVSYSRDGRSLYASSEKKNAPLYRITLR